MFPLVTVAIRIRPVPQPMTQNAKTRSGDGADRSPAIRAAGEAQAMYGRRIEALLEIKKEATQNYSQSCGKRWWTRTVT